VPVGGFDVKNFLLFAGFEFLDQLSEGSFDLIQNADDL